MSCEVRRLADTGATCEHDWLGSIHAETSDLAEQRLLRWRGRGIGLLLGDEHVGGDAEGNALLLEGEDDAAAEFAEDAVALVGADAGVDEVDDFATADVVDAEDVGVGDGDVLEGGILADVGGQLAEDCHDGVGVGAGVNTDGERGDGEVAG